jgi:hypothetical protein
MPRSSATSAVASGNRAQAKTSSALPGASRRARSGATLAIATS